jgi:glycosidase
VLFYGEEIGMAENLAIEGRYSVRAPMQWSSEPQAGFTTAEQAGRPIVEDGPFGYPELNVTQQRRDPDSLLNWMERLIRRRRECPELGWGKPTLLDSGDAAVFAQRSDWEGSTVVAVHNLAGRDARARLELGAEGSLVDLFYDEDHALDDGAVSLELPPYDARWFRVRRPGRRLPP